VPPSAGWILALSLEALQLLGVRNEGGAHRATSRCHLIQLRVGQFDDGNRNLANQLRHISYGGRFSDMNIEGQLDNLLVGPLLSHQRSKYFDGELHPIPIIITPTLPFGKRLADCWSHIQPGRGLIRLNMPLTTGHGDYSLTADNGGHNPLRPLGMCGTDRRVECLEQAVTTWSPDCSESDLLERNAREQRDFRLA